MCLLVPGKIIKIENNEVTVDYGIEQRQGMILENEGSNEKFKQGDYVLIQGGIVVQKVEEKEAMRALELYKKAIEEA